MPWEEHSIVFDLERIKARGFVSGERKEMAGIKGYQFYRSDSNSMFFKPETLIAMKYAAKGEGIPAPAVSEPALAAAPAPAVETVSAPVSEPVPAPTVSEPVSAICEPWEEHNIAFDEDMIRSKGYVSCQRSIMSGINGYEFTTADGSKRFIRVEMVLIQKLAHKLS